MRLILFLFSILLLHTGLYGQSCLSASMTPSNNSLLYNTIGNYQLDNYIARDVNVLRNFFNVNPSFFYIDDRPNNAYASKNVTLAQYTSGTVYFGKNLFLQEWVTSNGVTTIPMLISHEFGHIVDYKYNVFSTGEVTMTRELFADFMAGIFLKYRSSRTYTDLQATLTSFFEKGDYEFNDPSHHGTNEQRLAAVEAGYNWYLGQTNSGANPGVYAMLSAGKRYVLSLKNSDDPDNTDNTSSSSSDLSDKMHISTNFISGNSYRGQTTYLYKVTIRNGNDVDVSVTIGGLKYGYYSNCNADPDNFVEEGEFDEKTIKVTAHDSRFTYLKVTLTENPPYKCTGVPASQKATIIDVSTSD